MNFAADIGDKTDRCYFSTYRNHVFSLRCSMTNLELLPNSFGGLQWLQVLDLYGNHLNHFPDSINSLKSFLQAGPKSRKGYYHYYELTQLVRFCVCDVNSIVIARVKSVLTRYESSISKREFIRGASFFIEGNSNLAQYRDTRLYEHQKKLFTVSKLKKAKLILYQAPTGTGKTLSPLGLVRGHRLIFVCAAKHVGLQLAKSCISLGIKIAVAFGCTDPGGIRLHLRH